MVISGRDANAEGQIWLQKSKNGLFVDLTGSVSGV